MRTLFRSADQSSQCGQPQRRLRPPRRPTAARHRRLRIEALEDRRVLATYLSTVFDYSGLNTFEDQSREAFVDVNNDGAVGSGDVMVGFVRIDDHFPIVGGVGSTGNRIYAIFSQQIKSITGSAPNLTVQFEPTTTLGLRLSDLGVSGAPANAIVAVYSGFTDITDLIASSPGNLTGSSTVNLLDYFAEIRNNLTLSVIAGFGTGPTQADDYFTATTSAAGASLVAAGGATLIPSIPQSITVANFTAGLSILVNNDPGIAYAETVVSSNLTSHQLVIANGAVRGTAATPPVTNVGEWTKVTPDVNLSNPGGFINDADFFVRPFLAPAEARITITPDGTNAVGDAHTFTVTVQQDSGSGFVPAAGANVTVVLAGANGAVPDISGPSDLRPAVLSTISGTTNGSGQFQVTFTSATAGQVVANATASLVVNGQPLTRDTDPATTTIPAGPGGSGPATKTFVDARIVLSPPTATNLVNDPHTIVAQVWQDDGLTAAQGGDGVTGFAPAPNGTLVTFALTNSGGATATFVGSNTATLSGGSGSVQINSATAGTVTINATTTLVVGGVTLTRDTDPATVSIPAGPGGSGPVQKIYEDLRIDLEKLIKKVAPCAGEGLTPGFWKTHSIYGPAPLAGWPQTGYSPDDSYNAIFGVSVAGNPTLLQALNAGGGALNALLRHSTAALLNAAHPNVEYAYTVAQVISLTQAAILSGDAGQIESTKNLFETQNELGADLTSSGNCTPTPGVGSDADTPATALVVAAGETVQFTYLVSNPGSVGLVNVMVTDDNGTPANPADDFSPAPVLSGGFNVGDVDHDSVLDPGEVWQYTATKTVFVSGCNLAVATGTHATNPSLSVSDSDPACWEVVEGEPKGSLGGRKYRDLTGNGQSVDDVPLSGTTIYVDLDQDGVLDAGEPSAMTAPDGSYTIGGLDPGTYQVREVVPTGYVRTGPAVLPYHLVTIVGGGHATTNTDAQPINFYNFKKCDPCTATNVYFVINGTKTVTNLRGNVDQGDVVTVYFTLPAGTTETFSLVSYTAPDPYFDATRASLQEVFQVDTGTFTGPGTFSLTVQVPNCYFQIDFVCGPVIDRLGPAGSHIFYTPQGRLISADNDGTTPCTPAAPCTGSLSGYVWRDRNNDGVRETNEPPIAGATIKLSGTNALGQPVNLIRTTDADGFYAFLGLMAGNYTLTEVQPTGYVDGLDSAGSLGGVVSDDVISAIALAAGQQGTNYNFGELKAGKLSGYVYLDKDNDALKEGGESGIGNVKITLTGTDDRGNSVSRVVYTDSKGYYLFDNLRPGVYKIAESQPIKYADGQESLGSLGGTIGNDMFLNIILLEGDWGINYNFGERRK